MTVLGSGCRSCWGNGFARKLSQPCKVLSGSGSCGYPRQCHSLSDQVLGAFLRGLWYPLDLDLRVRSEMSVRAEQWTWKRRQDGSHRIARQYFVVDWRTDIGSLTASPAL